MVYTEQYAPLCDPAKGSVAEQFMRFILEQVVECWCVLCADIGDD